MNYKIPSSFQVDGYTLYMSTDIMDVQCKPSYTFSECAGKRSSGILRSVHFCRDTNTNPTYTHGHDHMWTSGDEYHTYMYMYVLPDTHHLYAECSMRENALTRYSGAAMKR
jgi:hypothetical protein